MKGSLGFFGLQKPRRGQGKGFHLVTDQVMVILENSWGFDSTSESKYQCSLGYERSSAISSFLSHLPAVFRDPYMTFGTLQGRSIWSFCKIYNSRSPLCLPDTLACLNGVPASESSQTVLPSLVVHIFPEDSPGTLFFLASMYLSRSSVPAPYTPRSLAHMTASAIFQSMHICV